jgi:hypothetical protein
MSSSSSHEIVVVAGTMALEIVATSYVALVDAIDGNILIIVLSTIVYKKMGT